MSWDEAEALRQERANDRAYEAMLAADAQEDDHLRVAEDGQWSEDRGCWADALGPIFPHHYELDEDMYHGI